MASKFEELHPKDELCGIDEKISWLDQRKGWLEALKWVMDIEDEPYDIIQAEIDKIEKEK